MTVMRPRSRVLSRVLWAAAFLMVVQMLRDYSKTNSTVLLVSFEVTGKINGKSFSDLVHQQAMKVLSAEEKLVTLCILDLPVFDIFENWHMTAKAVGIHNILPVALNWETYHRLQERGLPSWLDPSVSEYAHQESSFLSHSFKKKGRQKFVLALSVLKMGYAVLLSDIDLVFFKNPFPSMDCFDCDLEIQPDHPNKTNILSVGFVLFRPTARMISFLERFVDILKTDANLWDQSTFRKMVETPLSGIKYRVLPSVMFPTGGNMKWYMKNYHRMPYRKGSSGEFMALPPESQGLAVIFHNSWVGRSASKRYRLREMGFWFYDKDGYYSDPNRKYLAYRNPWKAFADEEDSALSTALRLSSLLNRTLILPKFHCVNAEDQSIHYPCSLQEVTDVDEFDELHHEKYREHSFLSNFRVPEGIKMSQTSEFFVLSKRGMVKQLMATRGRNQTVFVPASLTKGPAETEIVTWLKPYEQYSVIRFHSLYFPFAFG